MKITDIQFCPFCGKNEKLCYEQLRVRCHSCGRLFSVDEVETLRIITPGYKPAEVLQS